MKKIYLILILFNLAAYSQDLKTEAKNELGKLSEDFDNYKTAFDTANSELTLIKNKITGSSDHKLNIEELSAQFVKIKDAKVKLDSIYLVAQSYKTYYISKKVDKGSVNSYFKKDYKIESDEPTGEGSNTIKTFLYFGDDLILSEDEKFFKDKNTNDVFNKILKTESESYLGDFTIPKENTEITVKEFDLKNRYVLGLPWFNCIKDTASTVAISYKFKNIRLYIFEGGLYDVKATLIDENNNELVFENRTPISMIRFSDLNYKNYLYHDKTKEDNIYNEKKFIRQRIKLTDVLNYISNPGNSYVPDNITYEFPIKDEDKNAYKTQPVKYQIKQKTSLQNCLELRTYTDFLALFGDSPNGLVQVEGKADFFIAPLNLRNSLVYVFKKISPFVSFSRLDDIDKDLTQLKVNDSINTLKSPLEMLQKSYLKMGVKVNFFSFKLNKEYPFTFNLYTPVSYQIANLKVNDSTRVNFKSMGMGAGFMLEFRRFNNFGFNYSMEWVRFNSRALNSIDSIAPPDAFWVFKNEAEVYYYPNDSKEQSIFLRFNAFNDATHGNNDAFYQLQFGYRFSIGISKLKR